MRLLKVFYGVRIVCHITEIHKYIVILILRGKIMEYLIFPGIWNSLTSMQT